MKKLLQDMTEPELRDLGKSVGKWIENALPFPRPPLKCCGFFLAYTDTIEPGVGQYVSNIQRADAIRFLRETADRLEGREDIPR